ncbi:hypothetical protein [Fulvivirga ligni]|uniref:hypothetical protein n=1 Tax=Fulvivirga ligni TaxID=2904246 RepID=UPI001F19F3E3|nr:hypothetical protein [Fulvivirga ligni]UII22123.1 hypothetical protein LVD16_02620 [Fulvivirga ligni]
MTSRRIESHKNYYDVLKKHEKNSWGKKLVKLIMYIIILMGLLLIAYFAVKTVEKRNESKKEAKIEIKENTSRPDESIHVTLNISNNGKT